MFCGQPRCPGVDPQPVDSLDEPCGWHGPDSDDHVPNTKQVVSSLHVTISIPGSVEEGRHSTWWIRVVSRNCFFVLLQGRLFF